MDWRLLLRLAMGAAAFSAIAAAPAVAADDDCKSTVKTEGKPAPFRDLGAYPNSLLAWRKAVGDEYGMEYNSWRYAKDRDVDCDEDGGMWTCTRTAKPCKDMLHRILGAAKADCKSDSLSSYGRMQKTDKSAMEEAVSGWEIDARKMHGSEWAEWDNAVQTDIDCHKVGGGLQCIAVGTPCSK
jgi:hypothetical protein